MANPTPRADALRQMREAKFEAEQKRLKQETGKPAEAPKRKPEAAAEDKPAKPKAAPKAAKELEVAEIATAAGAEVTEDAPPAKAGAKKAAAPKAAAKKALAKKAKASAK